MDVKNILSTTDRHEFRQWLEAHPDEKECWVAVKRGRPTDPDTFYYLDAVEEALCFGWIDSTVKEIDGVRMQRFGPRKKNSSWTELNKERVRRLERIGLMTDRGRAVLPPMGARSFRIDPDIEAAMKTARVWSKFKSFPTLYQRVRAYNVAFHKNRDPEAYEKGLRHLIEATKAGQMYGEWHDYGRLLENLLPRDKHDDSTIKDLLVLGDKNMEPLIPELLTWLQDPNWPIFGKVVDVICQHSGAANTYILDIMRGADEVWKYNILTYLMPKIENRLEGEIFAEVSRMAEHPTEREIEEEVSDAAAELLKMYNMTELRENSI